MFTNLTDQEVLNHVDALLREAHSILETYESSTQSSPNNSRDNRDRFLK